MDTRVLLVHATKHISQVETVVVRLPSRTLYLPQLKEAFYKFAISKHRELGWTDRNRIRSYHKNHNIEYPYCFVSYKYDEGVENPSLEKWCEQHAPDIMSNTTNEPIVGHVFILQYEKSNSVTHCFTFKDIDNLKIDMPKVAVAKDVSAHTPSPAPQRQQKSPISQQRSQQQRTTKPPASPIVEDQLITFQGTSLEALVKIVTPEPWKVTHLARYLRSMFIAASQGIITVVTSRDGSTLAVNTNLLAKDQFIYAICFKSINNWTIYKFVTSAQAHAQYGFDNCVNEPASFRIANGIFTPKRYIQCNVNLLGYMKHDGTLPQRWKTLLEVLRPEELSWFQQGLIQSVKERVYKDPSLPVPALCPKEDTVGISFVVPLIDELVVVMEPVNDSSYFLTSIHPGEHLYGYCRVLGLPPKWLQNISSL
jgi:hypothetical protein